MKNNIDRPLAAILTLNTVAHTVGAAGVGAQAAAVFGSRAVGAASAVMTLLILVFSEIIPKTLGAAHAKKLALPAALCVRAIIWICYPVIIPLEWCNRALGYQRREERVSRAELLAAIRLGQDSGTLRKQEYRIAANLIALSSTPICEVLTPRTVVFSLPQDMTAGEALAKHRPIPFSRIPVYRKDTEDVTGYVSRLAIAEAVLANEGVKTLKALARPIPILPEAANAGDSLEGLIKKHQHMALVADEYGSLSGIVTLEDLLETLLGREIVDETDPVENLRELARKRGKPRPSGKEGKP